MMRWLFDIYETGWKHSNICKPQTYIHTNRYCYDWSEYEQVVKQIKEEYKDYYN